MRAASNGSAPSEIDSSTPILIFGLSHGALHHGALGIARSAGRLGIPVYRVGRERWGPAALSRYSRGWLAVSDRFSDEEILDTLLKLGGKILGEIRNQKSGCAILEPEESEAC